MKTKEVLQEKTVTAAEYSATLRTLVREHLIGLVKKAGERDFIFRFPGGAKAFRVSVTEEESE